MLRMTELLTATLVGVAAAASWVPLTDLPALPSGDPVGDGGCMAYDASTDLVYASKGNKDGDFYAYTDPTWTALPSFPLGAENELVGEGSAICSDGNGKLFLTKGNKTLEFWCYYEADRTWKRLTNVPSGPSGDKVQEGAGLAWQTKNGVGYVYLLKGHHNEFYRYDTIWNAWWQLLDAPLGVDDRSDWRSGSWLVADEDADGHHVYAFKAKYNELYAYDTDSDIWVSAKAAMPFESQSHNNKKSGSGSCAAWYDGGIYAFKGNKTSEFWRYDPEYDEWEELTANPPGPTVGAGGALAADPGTGVYALAGDNSSKFWRFTPDDKAGAQPSRDGVMAGSPESGSVTFAIAPNPLSGGLATIRYGVPKPSAAELSVYNVAGQTVMARKLPARQNGSTTLDLRHLGNGVYLVKLQSQTGLSPEFGIGTGQVIL